MAQAPLAPTYVLHPDLVHRLSPVPPREIVSELLHHDDHVKVTLFGCADGEQLSDQIASRSFILQVLAGDVKLVLDGSIVVAGAGSWMRMAPGQHEPITAVGEAILLLTLLKD